MTTTARVQAYLRAADLSRTRIISVAAELAMCESSLNRKLWAEGTRYRDLIDAERKRRAAAVVIANPRAAGWDIADACGYYSTSHVYSSFRRWFGFGLREVRLGAVVGTVS